MSLNQHIFNFMTPSRRPSTPPSRSEILPSTEQLVHHPLPQNMPAATSVAVSISPHWPGFHALKHLVIFGASYCQVGYNSKKPHPTPENPLGVEWPGITYAGANKPNWVGHLLAEHTTKSSLLVYNYSLGGETVFGVERQIEAQFLPSAGQKPDWAPWTASDTLFMTWVGINDCAIMPGEIPQQIDRLFQLQDILYESGARNFLFFNLPPLQRGPQVPAHLRNKSPFATWNTHLQTAAQTFATKHSDATVLLFSSWNTFTRVLDNPTEFGFTEEDAGRKGGIWLDNIHPTSQMHNVIARDLASFLESATTTTP